VATYYTLVPAFEKLLTENDGNLEKFYAAVERLGKLDKAERRKLLAQ
jgi:predicted aminopeptidase